VAVSACSPPPVLLLCWPSGWGVTPGTCAFAVNVDAVIEMAIKAANAVTAIIFSIEIPCVFIALIILVIITYNNDHHKDFI
jgi:hypothetical protein